MALLLIAVLALLVGGTLALGLWTLRRHDRQFPPGTRLREGDRKATFMETMTTWLRG